MDKIVIDAKEFQQHWDKVKNADSVVHKELRKDIRAIGNNAVLAVRLAAISIPANGGEAAESWKRGKGKPALGLRQGIANATELRVQNNNRYGFGMRVRVSGSKFYAATGKPLKLPRYMEGLGRNFQRWRHPVFARPQRLTGMGYTVERRFRGGTWKGEWAQQKQYPFLVPTMNLYRREMQEAVMGAFDKALKKAGFK
jgi:hypothetical protein